eukprot:13501757-Ditylum_brightwellii.AAC.1
MSKLYHLNTRSIDVVLAYPQAAIKTNIYLFPPSGVIIDVEGKDMVLKLKKLIWTKRCRQNMVGSPVSWTRKHGIRAM